MNINPDMDTLYSPSKWCRRFNGDGATKYFSDFIQRGKLINNHLISCYCYKLMFILNFQDILVSTFYRIDKNLIII